MQEAITIARPDSSGLQSETSSLLEQAQKFQIECNENYEIAGQQARRAVALRKKIVEKFKGSKSASDKVHKEICDLEKSFLAPAKKIEDVWRDKMGAWDEKQERLRQEQLEKERRIREKLEHEAAVKRREAEDKARLETERLKKEEEDRRLAEAARLEEEGRKAEADKVLEQPTNVQDVQPDMVPAPEVPVLSEPLVEKPQATGISTSKRWSAEVTDFAALVKAVAEKKAPLACLKADGPALNRLAVTLKETFDIPGVRAISKSGMSIR
jgi:hypothetical protein